MCTNTSLNVSQLVAQMSHTNSRPLLSSFPPHHPPHHLLALLPVVDLSPLGDTVVVLLPRVVVVVVLVGVRYSLASSVVSLLSFSRRLYCRKVRVLKPRPWSGEGPHTGFRKPHTRGYKAISHDL